MPKSPHEMLQAMLANLPKNTGRTADAWIVHLKETGLTEDKAIRAHLKEEQGFGTNQAWAMAYYYLNGSIATVYDDPEGLLKELFAKADPWQREYFDMLMLQVSAFGDDLRSRPCKTYIPLARKNQFAVIKPIRQGLQIGVTLPSGLMSTVVAPVSKLTITDRVTHHVTLQQDSPIEPIAELLHSIYLVNK